MNTMNGISESKDIRMVNLGCYIVDRVNINFSLFSSFIQYPLNVNVNIRWQDVIAVTTFWKAASPLV